MKQDYLRREERLLFTQSKRDRSDKGLLICIFCIVIIEVIAQIVKAI